MRMAAAASRVSGKFVSARLAAAHHPLKLFDSRAQLGRTKSHSQATAATAGFAARSSERKAAKMSSAGFPQTKPTARQLGSE